MIIFYRESGLLVYYTFLFHRLRQKQTYQIMRTCVIFVTIAIIATSCVSQVIGNDTGIRNLGNPASSHRFRLKKSKSMKARSSKSPKMKRKLHTPSGKRTVKKSKSKDASTKSPKVKRKLAWQSSRAKSRRKEWIPKRLGDGGTLDEVRHDEGILTHLQSEEELYRKTVSNINKMKKLKKGKKRSIQEHHSVANIFPSNDSTRLKKSSKISNKSKKAPRRKTRKMKKVKNSKSSKSPGASKNLNGSTKVRVKKMKQES